MGTWDEYGSTSNWDRIDGNTAYYTWEWKCAETQEKEWDD